MQESYPSDINCEQFAEIEPLLLRASKIIAQLQYSYANY
jgi:hypothetical protein